MALISGLDGIDYVRLNPLAATVVVQDDADRISPLVWETMVDGVALVNQAGMTGEDVPVRKEAPKRVVAGSVLEEGRLRIKATQVGDDTTTARISRFIQESLGKRSKTQRRTDELADKRVYLTLAIGGLVYALTRAHRIVPCLANSGWSG